MSRPRILYFDTERAPPLAWVWESKKPQIVNYSQYVQHGFFTSIQWQYSDETRPSSFSITDHKQAFMKDPTCDKRVVKKAISLINACDILVAHNGNRFDYAHIKGKAQYHRLSPINKPYIIDTLTEARTSNFPSNSLRSLSNYLKITEKSTNESCIGNMVFGKLEDRYTNIKKQTEYGLRDIKPMIELFNILLPFSEKHKGIYSAYSGTTMCSCGSTDVVCRGETRLTSGGNLVKRVYRCNHCGNPLLGEILSRTPKHKKK